MDLIAATDRVRDWALSRPSITVLASPDRTSLGWRVEAAAADRGWSRAHSPAEADVLVLVGRMGPELEPASRLWWHHMSAPRVQVSVTGQAEVDQALEDAVARLRDWPAQRRAGVRVDEATELLEADPRPHTDDDGAHAGHDMGAHAGHDMGAHAGHDMGAHAGHDMGGHAGHDMAAHAGHDMGGHAGHDMGGHAGHDMGSVAGLPMASTGQDRDGLELDVLTYRWGPFQPGWPAGLVLRATLSGDVVSTAEVERQPSSPEAVPRGAAVAHALVRVLELSGWDAAALALSSLPLAGVDGRVLTGTERRWLARVHRSRVLRWALRDIAVVDGQDAADRVAGWCEELRCEEGDEARSGQWTVHPSDALVAAVVQGTEMARARIAVASIALTSAGTLDAGSPEDSEAHHRHDDHRSAS